jgi:chemotaxis protein CheX
MVKNVADNPLADCLKDKKGAFLLTLPEAMPGETAANIADIILTARNNPLTIDAGNVGRIDTPCIQVLLSAARLWREDGEQLNVTGGSEAFEDNISTLGLTTAELEAGDANHA